MICLVLLSLNAPKPGTEIFIKNKRPRHSKMFSAIVERNVYVMARFGPSYEFNDSVTYL